MTDDGIYIDRPMRGRKLIVGVLLLVAPLVAGCGGSSGDRKAMEVKFEKLDFEISTLETPNSVYNLPHFEQATEKYIGARPAVRRPARSQGGEAPAPAGGDGISAYCLPCAGALTGEANRY